MAIRSRLLSGSLILLGACSTGPRIEISWTGADTGSVVLPASARRCGAGPVELTAMSGDTGIGIIIHAPDPISPGSFSLTSPDNAALSPPAATLAARWLDSTEVFAFRTVEGRLELESVAPLTGTFAARGRRWGGGSGEIDFEGAIRGVPIGPCEPADSGQKAGPRG